jgi:hypothetical protein
MHLQIPSQTLQCGMDMANRVVYIAQEIVGPAR